MATKTEFAANAAGTKCKCQFAPDLIGPPAGLKPLPLAVSVDDHVLLTSFESRGLQGATEVLGYLTESVETTEVNEGHLIWPDFPQFVKEHKWSDRKAVKAFADSVDKLIRASIKRGERKES